MATTANSTTFKTQVRGLVTSILNKSFGATLNREPDVINIVMALIQLESGYNPDARSPSNSSRKGTTGGRFVAQPSIALKLKDGTQAEKDNILFGLRAVGLMQVLGLYFIRGSSGPGKAELERLRPDLAGELVVEPGVDLKPVILGEANASKAITAGLIILEDNYKRCLPRAGGFYIKGDPYNRTFSSRIHGAVAAYLGLGKADLNGTTPEGYAASIIGGKSYAQANGKDAVRVATSRINVVSAAGPNTNGSSQAKITVAGCSPPRLPTS